MEEGLEEDIIDVSCESDKEGEEVRGVGCRVSGQQARRWGAKLFYERKSDGIGTRSEQNRYCGSRPTP